MQNNLSNGQRLTAQKQSRGEDERTFPNPEELLSSAMPRKFTDQVREFFAACLRPHSYNLFKNPYIWFGILWGMPIPLVTTSLSMTFTGKGHLSPAIADIFQSPLQWFFLAHPLLFGALFGILGSIRQEKDTQIQNLVEELRELSTQDSLTDLANRRHFIQTFEDEAARTIRHNLPMSIIFLDLDFFKKINDTYGHHMGDKVLREVSRFMQRQCRPYDTTARWGGEEFVILLPDSDETKAVVCAERIRSGIATAFSEEIPFPITISAGVALHEAGDSLERLMERADQALYMAKQAGRNRVVLWQAPRPAKDA